MLETVLGTAIRIIPYRYERLYNLWTSSYTVSGKISVQAENMPQPLSQRLFVWMSTSSESRTSQSAPVIALTGFMGVGKSTVGLGVANLLRWRFLDLDCEIESRLGRTIREIFQQQGEARFRKSEAQVLREVLESTTVPTVIALGGGTSVQPQNAELLRQRGVRLVFLELAVEELLQRCCDAAEPSSGNPRPLAMNAEAFRALYAQRLPLYRQSEVTIATRGKTPDEVAREIVAALGLGAIAAPHE